MSGPERGRASAVLTCGRLHRAIAGGQRFVLGHGAVEELLGGHVGDPDQLGALGEVVEAQRRLLAGREHYRLDPVGERRQVALEAVVASRPVGLQGHVERSEEHTSELQSLMRTSYAVFCLKKNKTPKTPTANTY